MPCIAPLLRWTMTNVASRFPGIVFSRLITTSMRHRMSNNWEVNFDPHTYLCTRYLQPGTKDNVFADFLFRCLHDFSRSRNLSSGMRVLEYGCGPVPIHMTSISPYASEIILAEYLGKNREAVSNWLVRDSKGYDWSEYIKYIVQSLEGGNESDVALREERLRSVTREVVKCDITQTPPISIGYEGPYDMVTSIFCVEAGSRTPEEYSTGIRNLVSMVKEGGLVQLFSGNWTSSSPDTHGFYRVGKEKFYNVRVTKDLVVGALERAGCYDMELKETSVDFKDPELTDMGGFLFVVAKTS